MCIRDSLWGETACITLAAVGFVLQALLISGSPVRVLRCLPAPAAP